MRFLDMFQYCYPLPLSAVGVALNLSSDAHYRDYARCEAKVFARVERVCRRGDCFDVWVKVVRGNVKFMPNYGFNAGDSIVVPFNFSSEHDRMFYSRSNFLQLVLACNIELDELTRLDQIVGRGFFMSIPVPCA